jgi:TPR repeat protein
LPVDIPFPENERQLEDESIEMHQLLLNISKAAKFTMFIVDACRDKPVNFKDTRDAGTPGLAKPDAVPDGVVVLYSAGAGKKALDNLGRNDTNPNGLFTRELLKQIKTPGLPVNELAQNVYERVKEQAARIGHEQTPGYYGQSGRFALVGGGLTSSSAPNTSATASALEVEIEFWRVAEKANTKVAYESYLQKYPSGQFVSLARAGIESVSRIQAPSASVSNNDSGGRSSNDDPSLVRLLYQIEDEAKRLRADQLDSLRRSAERGDPYAATLLGAWHENNDNPSVLLAGRSASIRWYRRAADKDYLPAMFMLAYAYQVGWVSGSADPSTAHKYYAAAEKRGYAPAQWGLARLIAANQPQAAVALLNKSAEQGYDKAMADLAFAYLKGIGTAPDPKSAEKWARAAYDEQQNEKAQHILGYLYWRKLIKARGETDELRLASFARLREAGGFAFGVE